MEEKKAHKLTIISNPERIQRIVDRVCLANVTVLMEVLIGNQKMTIKGTAFSLEDQNKIQQTIKEPIFVINNISKAAFSYLKKGQLLQGEFALLSSKIYFKSKILDIASDVVFLSLPTRMEAAERRKNLRHKASDEFHPYFDVNANLIEKKIDAKALEILTDKQINHFESYHPIKNFVRIYDISLDGICLISHFPFLHEWVKISQGLLEGQIIFPMQKPTQLILSVKWQKKGKMEDDAYPSYRVGCSYLETSPELIEKIKIFIHQLNQHAAI